MTQLLALAIVLSAGVIAWVGYRLGRWHGRQASAEAAEARYSVTNGYYDSAMRQVRDLMAERDQALLDLAEATRRIAVLQEDVEIALAARDAACAECDVAAAQWTVMAGERDELRATLDRCTRRERDAKGHFCKSGEAA